MGPQTKLADDLHAMKYRSRNEDFREAMNRIAFGLKDDDHHYHALREILLEQRFLPGGRVQGAIGATRQTTAFNCYVAGTIADSYTDGPGSIMARAHEAAATMRMGGGIGYDFSTLRPRGALVRKLQSQATGPISFMRIFNEICLCTASSGHRRGAQMGVLRCLSGDTMIHTLTGRFPISSLIGQRPYVYACDPKKKLVHIVQAGKIIVSDHNRALVRIEFDDWTHLDCTPDHRIMLSSGKFKEAGKLRRGDSIMAIEHSIARHGGPKKKPRYVRFVGCTHGRRKHESRLVARDILNEKVSEDWHAHHENEDSCDNIPSNIKMVSRSDHANEHMANFLKCQKATADKRRGRKRSEVYGEAKAVEWERRRQETRLKKTGAHFGPKNHKVVAVTVIGKAEFVYDISLPKWHNFAANGVFVHNCDHPDIEEFVLAKQNANALTGFNISVAVTDEFMEAALSNKQFDLKFQGIPFRTIDAADLWERIMRSTFDYAEPGVLFIDRVNEMNNLYYAETISATNPCGEQPLPPHGACLLGSFNLTKYISKQLLQSPHQIGLASGWTFDWDQLKADIPTVVRAMDNVTDRTRYPLAEQRAEALSKRRMGLGVTGLANTAEAMGHPYGSPEFLQFESAVLKVILRESYLASADLARTKGSFPLFDADRFLAGGFMKTLDDDIRDAIRQHGLRNSHLTSIAPTGTISMCADNVSSSIEPVFSYSTQRPVNTPDGQQISTLEDYGASVLGVRGKLAADVTAAEHVAVLTTAQRYIDSAVSKTINMDGRIMPWTDFKGIYQTAWGQGAKGCTTFNIAGQRMALLSAAPEEGVCTVDPETGRRDCA